MNPLNFVQKQLKPLVRVFNKPAKINFNFYRLGYRKQAFIKFQLFHAGKQFHISLLKKKGVAEQISNWNMNGFKI